MASSVYQVDFADGISGPAQQAANALKNLQTRIDADRKALRAMEKEMKALKRASEVNVQAVKALQVNIDKKKDAIKRAEGAFVKLSSGQLGSAAAAANLRGQLAEVGTIAQGLPSRLAEPISRFARLAQIMSGGASSAGILRVAIVALAAVLAVATVALAHYAIAQADARRAEQLHLAQLAKYKASGAALKALQSDIDAVSAQVSIGREDVAKYGAELLRSGLRGQALRDALLGASITASALGDKAGAAFVRVAKGPDQTAESIRRMAEVAKTKFGGVVQAQLLTLDVQAKKAKEGFATLFAGLDVSGYTRALKQVRDQFNNTSVAGKALQGLVDLFGQPIINAITGALKWFKTFWVEVLIGVYEILIGYQLVRIWFNETFGKSKTGNTLSSFFKWFQVGRVAVYVLAAAFGALAINVIAATWPFLVIAAAVVGFAILLQDLADWALQAGADLYDAIHDPLNTLADLGPKLFFAWVDGIKSAAVGAWETVKGIFTGFIDLFKDIFQISSPSKVFAGFGESLTEGLVAGLRSKWDALKGGVVSFAEGVSGVFKRAVEIGSPSKVFAEYGKALSEGVAVGVTAGAPQAQSAVAGIVDVPSVPAGPADQTAAPSAVNRGSNTITVGPITIEVATGDAQTIAQSLRREVEAVFETLAFEVGVTPAGAQ